MPSTIVSVCSGGKAPLACGYLRVSNNMADRKLRHMEVRIRAHAQRLGLRFVGFVYEPDPNTRQAWADLLGELERSGARHVIVPSMGHLSRHPLMVGLMLDHLDLHIGAEVHALDEEEGCRPPGIGGQPVTRPTCRYHPQ